MNPWKWQPLHFKGSLDTDMNVKVGETNTIVAGRSMGNLSEVIVHSEDSFGVGVPLAQLQADRISSIVLLPGGGLAAATARNFNCNPFKIREDYVYKKVYNKVYLFNSSAVKQLGNAYAQLVTSGDVYSLCAISGGGLAAASLGGWIDLFNASAVRHGGHAYARLNSSTLVCSLVALPDGGLAAGRYDGIVELFNSSALLSGGTAYAHLIAGRPTILGTPSVVSLLVLPDGGIAAGRKKRRGLWHVVVLFNSSVVHKGGPSYAWLRVRWEITSLIHLPCGSIAAGTKEKFAGTVELFDESTVQLGGKSYATLETSGKVVSLLALQGGGFAAGTSGLEDLFFVDLFNASEVRHGGLAYAHLRTKSTPTSLAELADGGLAAGTDTGSIDLYNLSAAYRGNAWERGLARLHASATVASLAALPDGGLAVGTRNTPYGVELFSFFAIQHGGNAYTQLHSASEVSSLVVLPDGGLAAGTWPVNWPLTQPQVLFFDAFAVQEGGHPYAKFNLSSPVSSLVALSSGTPTALTYFGRIYIFNLSAVQNGEAEESMARTMHGEFTLLAALPDGGFAAALVKAEGSPRTQIDLFSSFAVRHCGEPYAHLYISGDAQLLSLTLMPDRGLAVESTDAQVYLFNSSTLQCGGFPSKRLPGYGSRVAWRHHGWVKIHHNMHSIVFLESSVLISWRVFRRVECAASTYATNDGDCVSCPDGWYSLQGAASCPFQHVLSSSHMFFARVLLWIFIVILLCLPPEMGICTSGYWQLTASRKALLCVICAKVLFAIHELVQVPRGCKEFPTVALLPLALIIAALSSLVTLAYTYITGVANASCSRQAVWTALGLSYENSICKLTLVTWCTFLCFLEVLLYALWGVGKEFEGSLENRLSTTPEVVIPLSWGSAPPSIQKHVIEHSTSASRDPVSKRENQDVLERFEICESFVVEGDKPHSYNGGFCATNCTVLKHIARQLLRAIKFVSSWHGRHIILIANSGLNVVLLLLQMFRSFLSPQQGTLLACICLAIVSVITSAASVISNSFDTCFRWAVLLKACMILYKAVLLTFPKYSSVRVAYPWSCGPDALCPDWCIQLHRHAYCQSLGDQCMCTAPEANVTVLALTITTNVLMLGFTAIRTLKLSFRINSLLIFFVALGLNIAQLLFVGILSWLPISAYVNDPDTVLLMAMPIVPLALLTNEIKWILETWKEVRISHAQIYDRRGLWVFAAAYGLSSLVCVCCLSSQHPHPLLFVTLSLGMVSAAMAVRIIQPNLIYQE